MNKFVIRHKDTTKKEICMYEDYENNPLFIGNDKDTVSEEIAKTIIDRIKKSNIKTIDEIGQVLIDIDISMKTRISLRHILDKAGIKNSSYKWKDGSCYIIPSIDDFHKVDRPLVVRFE